MSERTDTERQSFIKKHLAKVDRGQVFWQGYIHRDLWTIEILEGVFRHHSLDKAFDMAMAALDAEEGEGCE